MTLEAVALEYCSSEVMKASFALSPYKFSVREEIQTFCSGHRVDRRPFGPGRSSHSLSLISSFCYSFCLSLSLLVCLLLIAIRLKADLDQIHSSLGNVSVEAWLSHLKTGSISKLKVRVHGLGLEQVAPSHKGPRPQPEENEQSQSCSSIL